MKNINELIVTNMYTYFDKNWVLITQHWGANLRETERVENIWASLPELSDLLTAINCRNVPELCVPLTNVTKKLLVWLLQLMLLATRKALNVSHIDLTVLHVLVHLQRCWYVLSPTRKETSYSYRRFWFSYILFIIIIGGILVLFIYKVRLTSNEIFSPSNKIQGCW